MTHDFIEAQEKTIRLPEDSPVSVRCYISWLYTGVVTHENHEVTPSVTVFSFADKVCDEGYLNDLVDEWVALHLRKNWFVSGMHLKNFYEVGLRGSEIAKFSVRSNVWCIMNGPNNWKEKRGLPAEFIGMQELMEDLLNETVEYQKRPIEERDPRRLKGCHFNVHTNGSPCSKAAKPK